MLFGKTRESLPCHAPSESRYTNYPPVSATPPRDKNAAVRAMLAKHEIDLAKEQADVRGAVARFLNLRKGTP